MDNEKIFVNGIWSYEVPETAPAYIKGKQAYKVKEFIKFLQDNEQYAINGFLTIVIKESQGGKRYAELDMYEYNKKNGAVENPITSGYDKFKNSMKQELPTIDANEDLEKIDVEDIPF